MAKKRGGGSSPGLVITLVFFILATIGLGVATYYGFAEQEGLNKQVKEGKKVADVHKAERDWYKFERDMYKAYIGDPPAAAPDKEEMIRQKESFDKGQSPLAAALKDSAVKGEVAPAQAYAAALKTDQGMSWDTDKGEKEPPRTFKSRIKDKDTAYGELAKRVAALEVERNKALADAADADKQRAAAVDLAKNTVASFEAKVKAHALEYQNELKDTRATLVAERALKGQADLRAVTAARERDAFKKDLDATKGKLTKATADSRKNKDEADRLQSQMRVLRDRLKVDVGTEEAEVQAARATQKLKDWDRNWRIVSVERLGTVQKPLTYVYINLGEKQRVVPQLTFSVHALEANRKLSPTPKGTIEVVRVVKGDLAKALVTSEKDPKSDPITKGDRLFNAIWDPTDQKRVAIAGLIDLTGDGADVTAEFVRTLQRQGIQVDAYLDMDTLKVKGKGLTPRTDYLIMGTGIEGSRHPKARDRAFSQQSQKAVNDMRDRARALGVPTIDLERYMRLTGLSAARPEERPGVGVGREGPRRPLR